ncbi:MAG: acyl--CoA ligase [Verrucomicrobia bacterium]|nr:acyl--CoA ligase [Verrucomicrobiota bacterium]
MRVLPDILREAGLKHPDRLALSDPKESVSYRSLVTECATIAHRLSGMGFTRGERAVIVLPNSVQFVRAHFSILGAGGISVPCDASITPQSFLQIVRSCEPRLIFTDGAGLLRLQSTLCKTGITWVVLPEPSAADPLLSQIITLEVLLQDPIERFPDAPIDPKSIASLMYTTGTTGQPKGVQLTHENVLAALRNIGNFIGYSADDREVVVLPLSHNFGLGHVYCNLMHGGAVYTEGGLARPGRVLKSLASLGATGFPGTPLGYGMLMDNFGPALAECGRQLRFIVINSAPLPPERTVQLQRLLPRADIMVYYGLTEASRSTFISLSRCGQKYFQSVGRPMNGINIQIKNEHGANLPPKHVGEVTISGPTVSRGYWRNHQETQKNFRNGRLHTGDLGYLDEDGFLFITGRLKDAINVGGYKVNPSEVEEVIRRFAGVADVGVVGLDSFEGLTGEMIVAALVAESGCLVDLQSIERQCLKHLEKFKVPSRFLMVEQIPRTDTGKLKRRELAEQLAKQF